MTLLVDYVVSLLALRPYVRGLYKRLSRKKQKKMKKKANKKEGAIVIHYESSTGKRKVFGSYLYICIASMIHVCMHHAALNTQSTALRIRLKIELSFITEAWWTTT